MICWNFLRINLCRGDNLRMFIFADSVSLCRFYSFRHSPTMTASSTFPSPSSRARRGPSSSSSQRRMVGFSRRSVRCRTRCWSRPTTMCMRRPKQGWRWPRRLRKINGEFNGGSAGIVVYDDDEHLENGTPEAEGWWTQGDSTVSCVVINWYDRASIVLSYRIICCPQYYNLHAVRSTTIENQLRFHFYQS